MQQRSVVWMSHAIQYEQIILEQEATKMADPVYALDIGKLTIDAETGPQRSGCRFQGPLARIGC